MITTVLFWAILAASCLVNERRGFYACATFATLTQAHDTFLGSLTGFPYFGSAALTDLMILALLRKDEPTQIAVDLAAVCTASLVGNMIGYAIWHAYLPSDAYYFYYVGLYGWALWLIINQGGYGDFLGYNGGAGRRTRFGRVAGKRRNPVSRDKGPT